MSFKLIWESRGADKKRRYSQTWSRDAKAYLRGYHAGHAYFQSLKTSNRTVAAKKFAELQNEIIKGAEALADASRVKCIRKGFVGAAKRAGLDVSPHDLRHTAATLMEEAGVEMQIISRFLAHKDQRTTSSIYSKPRPAHLIGAAEVVNFRRKA